MTSDATSVTAARAFTNLAALQFDSESPDGLRVRVVRMDGSRVEGPFFSCDTATLLVEDPAHGFIRVEASEVRTLEVDMPRRGREWVLAVFAGIGALAALIGYAHLPWVRPDRDGDMYIGFAILTVAVVSIAPFFLARTGLGRWLTKWRPLYPP